MATVADLIEALRSYPQDYEILIGLDSFGASFKEIDSELSSGFFDEEDGVVYSKEDAVEPDNAPWDESEAIDLETISPFEMPDNVVVLWVA